MLTTLRLVWPCVDDLQWSQLSSALSSARLHRYGCLSWHSRRNGREVRVTALWHDQRSLEMFVGGLLTDVARAAELATPTITVTVVTGIFGMPQQRRGDIAPEAPCHVPSQPAPAAAAAVPPQRRAA